MDYRTAAQKSCAENRKQVRCWIYKEDFTVLLRTYGLTTLYQQRIEHLLWFLYKKSKIDKEILNSQRPKMVHVLKSRTIRSNLSS